MLRSFELRLHPNRQQVAALENVLAVSCELYNAALQERKEAWKLQRKHITYFDQTRELTELRACDAETASLSADIAREPLRRVHRAFQAFYRRCKAGQKVGHPRYRSRVRYDSFATSKDFSLKEDRLGIFKVSTFRFSAHRELVGTPKHLTVKRLGSRWMVRIVCDIGPAPAKGAVSSAVGIDVGIATFATLSNGIEVENPRFFNQHAARVAQAQRNLITKKRGSRNRLRAKEVTRRAYQRITDCRKNFIHHLSKQLVARYDLIAHEDLNISRMVHSNLARSILDAAWGQLLFQLAYKAESAGRYVIAVNPRGTTQRCSGCGENVPKTITERTHDCVHCGLSMGRDHNAAVNVLALGRSAVEALALGSY